MVRDERHNARSERPDAELAQIQKPLRTTSLKKRLLSRGVFDGVEGDLMCVRR
jgi:hypothetical protein